MVVIFFCLDESLRCLADWNTSLSLLEHYPSCSTTSFPHCCLFHDFHPAVTFQAVLYESTFAFLLSDWLEQCQLFLQGQGQETGIVWIELLNDLMEQWLSCWEIGLICLLVRGKGQGNPFQQRLWQWECAIPHIPGTWITSYIRCSPHVKNPFLFSFHFQYPADGRKMKVMNSTTW